jgi:hypothetical protein
MVKKWSNVYSNGRIHIQTIKFEFKQTNQELRTTAHRLPWWTVVRVVPPDPALVRAGATPAARVGLHVVSPRRYHSTGWLYRR